MNAGSSETDLTVVLGETLYRVERGWFTPPASERALISQVAVGADGRIFVLQREAPRIVVLDRAGAQLAVWGEDRLADPHGITALADGRIAAVDRDAHEIVFFNAEGEVSGALGERHRPRFGAPFNHPAATTMADDGDIYVADGYGNSRVHRFDRQGQHLASWGAPGRGEGEFSTPHAVLIDRRERVLVADRENDRVQIFDRDGSWLGEWGDVYRPMDLAADDKGLILVTDQVPRVSLYDLDGTLLGRCRPVLNGAHGIDVAADGTVYLAEIVPSRVTRMVPVGAAH